MEFNPGRLPFERLSIPDDVVRERAAGTDISSFAFVNVSETVRTILAQRYGRPNLALKLVPLSKVDLEQRPGATGWGKIPLGMTSLVQNLLALHGLAPRIYGLARVNDEYAAQVTDYIPEDDRQPPRVAEVEAVVRELGVKTRHKNFDLGERNWRSGLLVDFSSWYMPDDAIDELVSRTQQEAMKNGGPSAKNYQQVPGLNLPGSRPDSRDLPSAVASLVPGRTVLDIGCNRGNLLRRAADAGALRAVGIEKDRQLVTLAQTINVLLGYWQLDIVQGKLPVDGLPNLDFDLIICLSAIKYIGDLDALPWLALLAPILWLEGHGGVPADYYKGALARAYHQVVQLPDATDNMVRAQFLCRN